MCPTCGLSGRWLFQHSIRTGRGPPSNARRTKECGRIELIGWVELFGSPSTVSISVQELRRLAAESLIARSLQLNRKTFARQAARRGIYPDYSAAHGRVRDFYNETGSTRFAVNGMARIRVLRHNPKASCSMRKARLRSSSSEVFAAMPGCAEPPKLVRRLISPLCADSCLCDISAHSERMSRYKLSRLLNAEGIQAVSTRETLYFDRETAHEAIQGRLERETSAVGLGLL